MINSGKSYSYWLARFNRKMSFHFPWVDPLISDQSVWHNGKQPKSFVNYQQFGPEHGGCAFDSRNPEYPWPLGGADVTSVELFFPFSYHASSSFTGCSEEREPWERG